jgi:hypothetical protein
MARRQRRGSEVHIEFAAAPGDDSLVIKAQLQTAERNFESSRAFIVADEQIRHAQCKGIQRPTGRNAKLAKTGASKILHRGQESRACYSCIHQIVILNGVKDLNYFYRQC